MRVHGGSWVFSTCSNRLHVVCKAANVQYVSQAACGWERAVCESGCMWLGTCSM